MKKIFLTLLILCGFCPVSFSGEITGKVMLLKDQKHTPASRISVRLHVYKDEYEFSGAESVTDKSGQYRFKNLQAGKEYAYFVYPIFEGINYPYEEIVFRDQTTEKRDFLITEPTGSSKDLSINELIFFEFGKKNIWKITHDIEIENKGNLMYHSDLANAEPVLFSLFEGGFSLSYLEGITRENAKIDDQKDTLQIFTSVAAGQKKKMRFSYFYVPSTRTFEFKREAFLQRSNISLFFPKKMSVTSEQFQRDEMLSKGQKLFPYAYTSGPIAQNQTIEYRVRGYLLQNDLLHILLFVGLALILGSMLFIYLRTKKSKKSLEKELTDKLQRYLIDLKDKDMGNSVDAGKVRNYLFQMYKKNQ
jgi:hypothetical protein